MNYGKKICNELKAIRKKIADANGISYKPRQCNHEGDCAGTCPACDAELRYIEKQLQLRQLAGKAAVVTGLSLGVASLTGCHKFVKPQPNGYLEKTEYMLEGDVIAEPSDSLQIDDQSAKSDCEPKTEESQ